MVILIDLICSHSSFDIISAQETRLSAESIWENTKHLLDEQKTPNNIKMIYIATDERDKNFFSPFKEGYEVRFLENYYARANLSELNQNHIGMIEQIICANAHTFIGTPRSTFTGYSHVYLFTYVCMYASSYKIVFSTILSITLCSRFL